MSAPSLVGGSEHVRANSTIVDLFCGCGGFSLGAELAGFKSISAVDVEPILQSGYRRNFPMTRVVEGSVKDIGASDWRRIIGTQRPDGVIGGPPCQGFSWIGKKQTDDPRNSLIHEFIRHVNVLRPKFFVMENVEGLLHKDKIGILQAALDALLPRYTVLQPIVINAADFGAATNRYRVVVIGFDADEIGFLDPEAIQRTARVKTTIRDAIADLPGPLEDQSDRYDMGWAKYPQAARSSLSKYAVSLRTPPPKGLGSAEAIERLRAGYVSGLTETRHSPEIANRYASIAGGKSDPITKSYKLTWDGLSPTLRAGTGAEKGAFQAVRPLHPSCGRVITVREAARIQGFPDWFLFHPTKWHSFRMIGNSVSPIVSQSLFSYIRTRMELALAA